MKGFFRQLNHVIAAIDTMSKALFTRERVA